MSVQRTTLLLFLFIIFISTDYLKPCKNFHESNNCAKIKKGFNSYGQSASALLEIDSTSVYQVIFYGKKDYILTICTERGFYPVHYRLVEDKSKQIIYDNMEDDYYESIGFTVDKTKTINVEITILGENVKAKNFGENQACVGVHIQWKKAAKIGF